MLVLTSKKHETVFIGDDISIKIVEISREFDHDVRVIIQVIAPAKLHQLLMPPGDIREAVERPDVIGDRTNFFRCEINDCLAIGPHITVLVLDVPSGVKLGYMIPKDVRVLREKVYAQACDHAKAVEAINQELGEIQADSILEAVAATAPVPRPAATSPLGGRVAALVHHFRPVADRAPREIKAT